MNKKRAASRTEQSDLTPPQNPIPSVEQLAPLAAALLASYGQDQNKAVTEALNLWKLCAEQIKHQIEIEAANSFAERLLLRLQIREEEMKKCGITPRENKPPAWLSWSDAAIYLFPMSSQAQAEQMLTAAIQKHPITKVVGRIVDTFHKVGLDGLMIIDLQDRMIALQRQVNLNGSKGGKASGKSRAKKAAEKKAAEKKATK